MKRLVIDIETNLTHDTIWLAVTRDMDTGEVQCHRSPESLKPLIAQNVSLTGHNVIAFDAYHLNRLWGTKIRLSQLTDTLILSRLLNPEIDGGHSLDAWGNRLKYPKSNFTDFDAGWSQEMQDYCIQDTLVTEKLYHHLYSEVKKNKFSEQSIELEHKVQAIIAKQIRNGWPLDIPAATLLLSNLKTEQAQIELDMQKVFAPTISLMTKRNYAHKRYYTKESLPEELLPAALRAIEESCKGEVRSKSGSGDTKEKGTVSQRQGPSQMYDAPSGLRNNNGAVQRNASESRREVQDMLPSSDEDRSSSGSLSQDRKSSRSSVQSVQHGIREGERFSRDSSTYDRLSDYAFKVEPFNPGSRQQIADRLMKRGWKPKQKTEKDNIIVNEKTLAECPIPEAKIILRYLMLGKRVSQIEQWLTAAEADGRVHGRVITNGAVTGRMTHMAPNMAQVPAVGKEYGKECRSLFITPNNWKLVGIDASGLELRMLAHYMRDQDYVVTVTTGTQADGTDVHTVNQKAAGLATRAQAKTFIYALL